MAPLPSFDMPDAARPARVTITRSQAAARLGMAPAGVDKLIRAGLLTVPLEAATVDELAARRFLKVVDGELTVLRTDAQGDADPSRYAGDNRRFVGFGVGMDPEDRDAANLRWWRSDPARVLDNQLFAVTVATFPGVVYDLGATTGSIQRPGEDFLRYRYSGRALAWLSDGLVVHYAPGIPGHLRTRAAEIMASRIHAPSGGPIAYLGPDPSAG